MPKKKHELIQLKRSVPKGYGITNTQKEELQDLINEILAQNNE
jgi:hypothetical protein